MIKAWRCRELNRIIIGDSISVSCDDCFSDKICTIKLVPCDAEEVVVIPKAEQLKVQAALAAAGKALNHIIAQLDCFMGQVKLCSLNSGAERQLMAIGNDLPKARETLTQIREVTK